MTPTWKMTALVSAAALSIVACAETSISSPGTTVAPTTTPLPTTPPSGTTAINLVPSSGCPSGSVETTYDAVSADNYSEIAVCSIGSASGTTTLTSDVSIPANMTIAIEGPVFVGQDSANGGTATTLTLGAGVRIFGASAGGTSGATDDYIVVSRGSSLEALGTEISPIRMTARAAINDEEAGTNLITPTSSGLWGGLVLNGNAPINACEDGSATGGTTGCEKTGEGSSGLFGGGDAADSSGTLQYLIVEYAGARLTNTDELNGIAFQGVGSGTTVDHIQVHNNLDDGIEWFGGTVNAKYVAITGAGDDSLDWTDGWTGNLQYAAVRSTNASSDDPRGIEADSNSTEGSLPYSSPSVSNFTLVGGANNLQGILLRRGTRGNIVNGLVVGYGAGIDVDGTETFTGFDNGDLVIESIGLDTPENFTADSDGVPAFTPANNIREIDNSLSELFFPGTVEAGIPVSSVTSGDAFFDTTSYVGAFAPTESVGNSWANFTLTNTLFDEAPATCPTGTTENGTVAGKTLCQIGSSGGDNVVSQDLALTDGDELIYEIVGQVYVGTDRGPDPASPIAGSISATLSIEPGVTIVGEGNDDYLIVTRGNQILSNGTATAPVVFTAKGAIDGTAAIEQDTKGIWGGVIINGRAPINACQDGSATGGTVDCEKQGEGSSGPFGGASADDDSGQIFYTRVEYAGVQLTSTDELNGIAFQGVGSGTQIDYVQVYNNLDDCFEWFGGTVNATHLIATGCGDDSLDWTDGYTGSIQYAIVYGGVASATGGVSTDPRGIEGDNLSADLTATPVSSPKVSNFTIISGINPADAASSGTTVDTGVVLRRGMEGTIANGIVLEWPDAGLDVDSPETINNYNNGDLVIQSLFLSGNGDDLESDGEDPTFTAANNIATGQAITTSGFTFRTGRPGVVPGANENAVPVYDVTGIGALSPTTYIGAVEDANDDWYLGWSRDQAGSLTTAN